MTEMFSRSRLIAIFLFTVILAFAVWVLYGYFAVAGIETPTYTVVSEHEDYEIRQYEDLIIVTTRDEGHLETVSSQGFLRLYDYISGGNALNEEIAMTAPVIAEQATMEADTYSISFVLPSKYTMDELPMPTDPSVRVEKLGSLRFAVLSFTGTVDEIVLGEKMTALRDALERDGQPYVGELILARYNPPFTPWFLQRNEIWAELAEF